MLHEKPVPVPARPEVLARIEAVAICATDLEIIHSGSPPRSVLTLTNSRLESGSVWKSMLLRPVQRRRQGINTSCLNYGKPEKGHRADGFTTDGGFAWRAHDLPLSPARRLGAARSATTSHSRRHRHKSRDHRNGRRAGMRALRHTLCAFRAGGCAGSSTAFVLLRETLLTEDSQR